MESRCGGRVWYFFSDDLPDEELIVPFKTRHGLAFGVRPGSMTQEMLDQLNRTADFVLGVGLAQLNVSQEKPPEQKE